jgi:hypothetical protein
MESRFFQGLPSASAVTVVASRRKPPITIQQVKLKRADTGIKWRTFYAHRMRGDTAQSRCPYLKTQGSLRDLEVEKGTGKSAYICMIRASSSLKFETYVNSLYHRDHL